MASILGLTHRTYQRLEVGEVVPDLPLLCKISEKFKLPLFEVIDYKKPENTYRQSSREEILKLPNGGKFLEIVDVYRSQVISNNKSSCDLVKKITADEAFQKAPFLMAVSNAIYAGKNEKFSKLLREPLNKIHEAAEKFEDCMVIVSWLHYIFGKIDNYCFTEAIYKLKGENVKVKFANYTTHLGGNDHIMLVCVYEIDISKT
jgi:DNA-binding XRE family transcriptional regulator